MFIKSFIHAHTIALPTNHVWAVSIGFPSHFFFDEVYVSDPYVGFTMLNLCIIPSVFSKCY